MKSIPVTILTGFLGAGKTTFLNDFLRHYQGQKWAVIENEWGQENIDSTWIQGEEQPVFPLTQGCICCTLNEQFFEILREIHQSAETWDGLLIETTGVADPAGVLRPFLLTPALRNAFPLAQVICVVDPAVWHARVDTSVELRRQAAYASVFVLTKADQGQEETRRLVKSELNQLFPQVPVFSGEKGQFPLADITAINNYHIPTDVQFGSSAEHRTQHISSLTLRFHRSFDLPTLRWRLAGFLAFQAADVWRLKGWIRDSEGQVWALQSVGNQFMLELAPNHPTEESVLVLIGKELKRPGYEKFFNSCLLP